MFGLKIPSGADTVVQIRLTVSRGRPPVVWQGSPDHSDDAVTADLLAKQNVAAYLWAALNRGKLQEDDLGFAHIPARVVAMRHGEIVFAERVSIPLMMPPRASPTPTPDDQAQRDMLTMVETALSTMQRHASEAIAQVSIASINALREINAAQAASMERAQQTLERIGPVCGREQDAGSMPLGSVEGRPLGRPPRQTSCGVVIPSSRLCR